MPNPHAQHPMIRPRIPRLEPLERVLILLALAILFFLVNACRAGYGYGHLELTDAKANSLIGNIASLLPMLFVLLALMVRRSIGRSAALILGVPVAILGMLTAMWQGCFGPEQERHTGRADDRPCRSIPLDGGATLNAYILWDGSLNIMGIDIKQQILLLPGLAWKRQIFRATFAKGCPDMERQSSQHVALTFPTSPVNTVNNGHPEPQSALPQARQPRRQYRTLLIDLDDLLRVDARR